MQNVHEKIKLSSYGEMRTKTMNHHKDIPPAGSGLTWAPSESTKLRVWVTGTGGTWTQSGKGIEWKWFRLHPASRESWTRATTDFPAGSKWASWKVRLPCPCRSLKRLQKLSPKWSGLFLPTSPAAGPIKWKQRLQHKVYNECNLSI